jgi:hypothetical protein
MIFYLLEPVNTKPLRKAYFRGKIEVLRLKFVERYLDTPKAENLLIFAISPSKSHIFP